MRVRLWSAPALPGDLAVGKDEFCRSYLDRPDVEPTLYWENWGLETLDEFEKPDDQGSFDRLAGAMSG